MSKPTYIRGEILPPLPQDIDIPARNFPGAASWMRSSAGSRESAMRGGSGFDVYYCCRIEAGCRAHHFISHDA
jgi:hypothetical protein